MKKKYVIRFDSYSHGPHESDSIECLFCRALYKIFGSDYDDGADIFPSDGFTISRRDGWFKETVLVHYDFFGERTEHHTKKFKKYCREF